MFVNACFIDQELFDNDFEEQKWHVHSKYKNSFNIQDERKQQLVVVTTTNYPFMPNGIYLEAADFSQILATVEIGEQITWQQNSLHFSKNHLFLMHGKRYSSVMETIGEIVDTSLENLFLCSNVLINETGSQHTLAEFVESNNPFSEAIQQLCLEERSQLESGLEFLLGRGLGLTPSGDDMIVGHLAARLLLRKKSAIVNGLLTELLSEQTPTTDISKHYLLCALSGRFSEPVLKLVDVLTTNSTKEQIEKAVRTVISVGHTSGVDLLAGLLTTIKFFESK
ncbi:DUF2877 domain-containing protein [Enterococcus caccae]|uniref:DUF2877 domain-containing protein n=1 Tax=Enterococcus caccae ATCC BAA-1240 TaxID=1158612 RepID=R3TN41_9ENTE|nr:DUF2877 domain-containing protein [Enterococcus caccae]EOL42924.1 hypothetical protein UC7_03135 [Enterococcus caccae ATCC BAA-1240]EOT67795.1 hypothetical protein I580_00177 [Enterococcus caccae ATCC BAA-1240]OJG28717.1 hypothetical protein RU98_GL000310 [Enterococcus caccae]